MRSSKLRHLPRNLIRVVGIPLIRMIYRIQTRHAEQVPREGGVLILPNHVTFADAFLITAAAPRRIRFVMDEAFMASPAIRFFVSIFETVTIRRDQPREAIRITIDALKNGDAVVLFPEGQLTRTGTLSELRRGFELIARKAGFPLVPLWCDGSWGSIFSFERGKFFKKKPYGVPYRLCFSYGTPMPASSDLDAVRHEMLVCSADAIALRFSSSEWAFRTPSAGGPALRTFESSDETTRRKIWANGHQIGQVNALQRKQPFSILRADEEVQHILPLLTTFPDLFGVEVIVADSVDASAPSVWVGGEKTRVAIENSTLSEKCTFYDFSERAFTPLKNEGWMHYPCLALEGMVIAMSMAHPPMPENSPDEQLGNKPNSWGKLLPGWSLSTNDQEALRVHGPAAPAEGITLPAGTILDAEGFLKSGES